MADYLLPLNNRKEIAEDTMAFWFDTAGTNFNFKPGQYATFTLINPPKTDEEGNMRQFSIASSPNNKKYMMIASRMRDTAFKNSLKNIKLGTKLKVSGPFGSFTLHEDSKKPAVFLAGGIGITPFRSIIEYAAQEKLPHKIYLFYSNKTPQSTAFFKDLEDFAKQNKNFIFVPTCTEYEGKGWRYELGRCNINMVKKYVKDLKKATFYSAGPPGMVAAMKQMLLEAGIKEESIRTEDFIGY